MVFSEAFPMGFLFAWHPDDSVNGVVRRTYILMMAEANGWEMIDISSYIRLAKGHKAKELQAIRE